MIYLLTFAEILARNDQESSRYTEMANVCLYFIQIPFQRISWKRVQKPFNRDAGEDFDISKINIIIKPPNQLQRKMLHNLLKLLSGMKHFDREM